MTNFEFKGHYLDERITCLADCSLISEQEKLYDTRRYHGYVYMFKSKWLANTKLCLASILQTPKHKLCFEWYLTIPNNSVPVSSTPCHPEATSKLTNILHRQRGKAEMVNQNPVPFRAASAVAPPSPGYIASPDMIKVSAFQKHANRLLERIKL